MTQTVFAPTEHYTSVATLIANMKAAKRSQPAPIAVGQRVEACIDGTMQQGTVQEVHPVTGFLRVAGDQAWMHEWLPPQDVFSKPSPTPAIAALTGGIEVGARVNVPALGIVGKLVAVQPSSVEGGTTRFRIGWLEGKAYREAGFWLEDMEVVGAAENAADEGAAALSA
jgi:hypothetical protein